MNSDNMNMPEGMEENKSSALSIAAFVLGILSFITCCFLINVPLGIISIILAVVALIKKSGKKPLAIIGMVLSIISILYTIVICIMIAPIIDYIQDIAEDLMEFAKNRDAVVEEYNKTGELPDYMDKYMEGELGEFFNENYGGFEKFFNDYLKNNDKLDIDISAN